MVIMVTSVAPSRWPHDCCVPVFRDTWHRGPEAKDVLREGAGGGGSGGGGNGGDNRNSSSTIMMITLIAVCQFSETCGIGVQRRRAYCLKEPVVVVVMMVVVVMVVMVATIGTAVAPS